MDCLLLSYKWKTSCTRCPCIYTYTIKLLQQRESIYQKLDCHCSGEPPLPVSLSLSQSVTHTHTHSYKPSSRLIQYLFLHWITLSVLPLSIYILYLSLHGQSNSFVLRLFTSFIYIQFVCLGAHQYCILYHIAGNFIICYVYYLKSAAKVIAAVIDGILVTRLGFIVTLPRTVVVNYATDETLWHDCYS